MTVKHKIGDHIGDPVLMARIRDFRVSQLQCDQKTFARMLGVSQAIVSQWETGRYAPSPLALMAIGRLDHEHKEWWFGQAGSKHLLVEQNVQAYKDQYQINEEDNTTIFLYGDLDREGHRFLPEEAGDKLSLPRKWFKPGQHIVGVLVEDDAMAPLLRKGFIALVDVVDRDLKELVNEMVAIRRRSAARIHWLREIGGSYYIVSNDMSDKAAPIPVKRRDRLLVGRVVRWIGKI